MAQSFILGTEGNQPFNIKSPFVSREHARIDIDDHGQWTITDLQSTNGTLVRDDNTGDLIQVSHIGITPLTFICLGPNTSKGCTFYARQLLSPGNYDDELAYMNRKEDEYDAEVQRMDKTNKQITVAMAVIPLACMALLMLLWKEAGTEAILIRMGLSAIPAAIIKVVFNPTRAKKKLAEYYDHFRICPNPACQHKMKHEEIRAYDCARCHC